MRHWIRVSRDNPCPLCGRPDWCLIHRKGSAVICPRTEEGSRRSLGAAGYLHRVDPDSHTGAAADPRIERRRPAPDFALLADNFESRITGSQLGALARMLGVSEHSLRRLHVGWTGSAYSFPMKTARQSVSGIRLRTLSGQKWSVTGSRQGLFLPSGLTGEGFLLICEGPTDTAAMLDLGFDVVGRPSCTGGDEEIKWRWCTRAIVIIADNDGPGRIGAERLADRLYRGHPSALRVITPPRGKDAREWCKLGATRAEVIEMIRITPNRMH